MLIRLKIDFWKGLKVNRLKNFAAITFFFISMQKCNMQRYKFLARTNMNVIKKQPK